MLLRPGRADNNAYHMSLPTHHGKKVSHVGDHFLNEAEITTQLASKILLSWNCLFENSGKAGQHRGPQENTHAPKSPHGANPKPLIILLIECFKGSIAKINFKKSLKLIQNEYEKNQEKYNENDSSSLLAVWPVQDNR